MPGYRQLRLIAFLNVAVHVAALALAAIVFPLSTPLAPLTERRAFLAQQPAEWTIAWSMWMACAMVMVAFAFSAVTRLPHQSATAILGVIVAVAAASIDLCCDVVQLVALPWLAASDSESDFIAVERITGSISLIVANGLYAISTLLIAVSAARQLRSGRLIGAVGWAVFGFGMLLAAASFTGVPEHAKYATAPTILAYCLWVILITGSISGVDRCPE